MNFRWFLTASSLIFTATLAAQDYTQECANTYVPPCKVRESMPLGACWDYGEGAQVNECDCDEDSPQYICVENVLYDCLNPCCIRGVWLPEAPPLFLPFKADPRQLQASVGLRFFDQIFGSPLVDVSYFDIIPVIRFFNLFKCGDQLELDIDGGLWAFFQTFNYTAPLVNADYFIGGSVNYALDTNWTFRFRVFHISSHIGDEFLLLHPDLDRKNPSAEYLDLFASYSADPYRVYAGFGYIPLVDPTFRVRRWYLQGGAEYYFPFFQFISLCHMIEGRPYVAANISFWDNHNWNPDQTYVIGYEVAKLYGLERKLRLYLEFHDGYSFEGQFCDLRTQYLSLRLSYGF